MLTLPVFVAHPTYAIRAPRFCEPGRSFGDFHIGFLTTVASAEGFPAAKLHCANAAIRGHRNSRWRFSRAVLTYG
jgi:hypothetical protein